MGKSGIQAAALAAIAAMGLVASQPARASLFTFTVTEQGGNVDVAGSGSISLTGLISETEFFGVPSQVAPLSGLLTIGGSGNADVYRGASGPAGFGSFNPLATGKATASSDIVGVIGQQTWIVVPQGFVSGDSLSGDMTFDSATFASLGLTPGVYTYTWGNSDIHNKLIVDIETPSGVPEPSTWAMLALGFIGLAALGARRGVARHASA